MRYALALALTAAIGAASPAATVPQQPVSSAPRPGAPTPSTTPRDGTPPVAPMGEGVIRGVVTDRLDGAPLPRAVVTVGSRVPAVSRTARTEAEGMFEVGNLPAGRYTVQAIKTGFLGDPYDQQRPQPGARKSVSLDTSTSKAQVSLSLTRGGVIAGRVFDEFGEPLEAAQVTVLRQGMWRGQRQWVPYRFPQATNDLGEYRIARVEPGSYLLSATPPRQRFAEEQSGALAPTYYPDTARRDEAEVMTLEAGQTLALDLTIVRTAAVKVAGLVLDATGKPASGAVVSLSHQVRGPGFSMTGGGWGVQTDQNGQFVLERIAPGDYIISAQARESGTRAEDEVAQGQQSLAVTGDPLTGVTLVLSKGVTLSGRIVFEPPPRDDTPIAVRVVARLQNESRIWTANTDATNAFVLRGLRGRFSIDAHPNGPSRYGLWALRGIRHRGRDVTDIPFEAKGADFDGIELIVSNVVTIVTGEVAGLDDERDYAGLVFSEDPARWTPESRYVQSSRVSDGRFIIRGLPPGRYLAAVVDQPPREMEPWQDPDWLERLRPLATPFTLAEGERKPVRPGAIDDPDLPR